MQAVRLSLNENIIVFPTSMWWFYLQMFFFNFNDPHVQLGEEWKFHILLQAMYPFHGGLILFLQKIEDADTLEHSHVDSGLYHLISPVTVPWNNARIDNILFRSRPRIWLDIFFLDSKSFFIKTSEKKNLCLWLWQLDH